MRRHNTPASNRTLVALLVVAIVFAILALSGHSDLW